MRSHRSRRSGAVSPRIVENCDVPERRYSEGSRSGKGPTPLVGLACSISKGCRPRRRRSSSLGESLRHGRTTAGLPGARHWGARDACRAPSARLAHDLGRGGDVVTEEQTDALSRRVHTNGIPSVGLRGLGDTRLTCRAVPMLLRTGSGSRSHGACPAARRWSLPPFAELRRNLCTHRRCSYPRCWTSGYAGSRSDVAAETVG
jgi:hypothetical protein